MFIREIKLASANYFCVSLDAWEKSRYNVPYEGFFYVVLKNRRGIHPYTS